MPKDPTETDETKNKGDDPIPPAEDAPESDWKAHAREWEKRAKANAKLAEAAPSAAELTELRDKAKKHDDAEEANRTETEKAIARAEKAEADLAKRTQADDVAKIRKDVAKAKGLPESALRGSTKEELEEHADELIEAGIKPAAAPTDDGQGDVGEQVAKTGEKTAEEVVAAATAR